MQVSAASNCTEGHKNPAFRCHASVPCENHQRKLPCNTTASAEMASPKTKTPFQPRSLSAAYTLSGATGWTSNTAFSRSLMTVSWPFLPARLISRIWASASLAACCSAFLSPCVCCGHPGRLVSLQQKGDGGGRSVVVGGARTSAWKLLNSCSFSDRYVSISFLASSRASLTRFVRTVPP